MMDRRAFLTLAGGLGLAAAFSPPVWAAPGKRTLALLAGINDSGDGGPPLQGALTDLALWEEVLTGRYRVESDNILTLKNQEASAVNLESALTEHVLRQAQPGDGVLIHFSGYGVIREGNLALKLAGAEEILPLTRLQSLLQSLKTGAVSVVLDCGFTPHPADWLGNLRCRNPRAGEGEAPALKPARGTWLWAAPVGQTAAEWRGNGFQAGFFTYSLTQTLWRLAEPQRLTFIWNRLGEEMIPVLGDRQQSQVQGDKLSLPGNPRDQAGATGQILKQEGQSVRLTLPGALPALQTQGLLHSLYRTTTEGEAWLEITEQNGRFYKGVAPAPLGIGLDGAPVQEALRVLSQNIRLTVALGENLERIERVDATGALESIETVAQVINSGEGPADCILDKSPTGGYALLSAGGAAFPQGGAAKSSAIKAALGELPRPLNTLLALKLLRLTHNEAASDLGITATLERRLPTGAQPLSQRRTGSAFASTPRDLDVLPRLNPGDRLQIRWQNTGAVPLYALLAGLTPKGKLLALLGPTAPATPQSSQTFPGAFAWPISRSPGWGELFFILSAAPFVQCRELLSGNGDIQELADPTVWARALLADLAQTPPPAVWTPPADAFALNLAAWATLPWVYQVLAEPLK